MPNNYLTKKILFLFLSTFVFSAHADIYYCADLNGTTNFRDSECKPDELLLKKVSTPEEKVTQPSLPKTINNHFIEDGKPGKLIFSDNKPMSPPYKIKVHEVRIITETDDRLVVDVIYTYDHKIPAEEIKIYITPNHGYWSVSNIQAEKGLNVGRASIGLSKSNMKKDRVKKSFTDTISVRFEHYAPKKYKGIIWTEVVKYEKNWVLKK